MNLGLGTLNDLKQIILPQSLKSQSDRDGQLILIGKGVAAEFANFCNRKFGRVENDTCVFSADRTCYFLPRYPFETVTKLEIRPTAADGWLEQPLDVIINQEEETGLVDFVGMMGAHFIQFRVTYTGGYWFETLEPSDAGYPSAMPDGATPLPDDLKMAWILQVQAVFEGRDRLLPKGLAPDKGKGEAPAPIVLIEEAERILNLYRRHQLT